ncbi:MAG: helix-turn-helix domain-containing protein [Proteobacteria bacterium]|nr:helix-turn-helix domain-containing protein [Pseudomonadota bacterium]MBS0302230.1 helix-turn-helix domain-containing protein [Pseudomonadota bacterium]
MTLASLRLQGWSIRAIATLQGRSPSTTIIIRELRRNSCDGSYAGTPAQRKSAQRRIDTRPLPKLRRDRVYVLEQGRIVHQAPMA